MGRSIRLVVVGLVLALAVAACSGKDEAGPQVVVELLIFDVYANVNRTTVVFSEQSFLNTTLVNAQREAVLIDHQLARIEANPSQATCGLGRGHAAAGPPAGRQHQAAVRRQGAGAVRGRHRGP